VSLGRVPGQGFAAAEEQAKIRCAFEQAEEVLGGIERLVDAQGADLVDLRQQALHALQHPLRTCLEEDQREFRVLTPQRHDQAMQVHRFIAVDQQMKASGDVQQHILDRHAVGQFEEQRGQLLFAFGHHGRGEQRLLIVEVTVNGQLRYTGFCRHRVHAGACVTIA